MRRCIVASGSLPFTTALHSVQDDLDRDVVSTEPGDHATDGP